MVGFGPIRILDFGDFGSVFVGQTNCLSVVNQVRRESVSRSNIRCMYLSVEHSIMYSTVSSNKNKAFVCPSQPLLCRSKIQTDGLLATAIQVHPHRQDLAIRSQRPILLAKEKKRESPKKKSGINFKNSGAQQQTFRRAPSRRFTSSSFSSNHIALHPLQLFFSSKKTSTKPW